ncbi:hypothetical protein Poli38472_001129 [Pythium oligandrum]|uniref:Kinesin motor domain-containing protein n=1 Tax=Pythium oligandrum TaxID=41045 RepID=A0A8K1CU32_PYTOL|nr:hypothetical protein Poli38472_001129 [Pythium oligandrum]|eukprot:TMW68973.1 hypothetical protein Poli38472_001129 [Pythium oligandrum]
MVKLFCAVVGVGSVFSVDIDISETVGDLKKKIKEENPNSIGCDAALLKLYLAREGDTWLNSRDAEIKALKKGEIPDRIKSLMQEELLLDETWDLNDDAYFGNNLERVKGDIHVLVELPSAFGVPSVQQTGLWLVRGSIANALSTKGIRAKLYRLAGMFLGYYDPARYTGDSHSALWYEDKTLCIHVLFKTEENALQFENAMQDEPVTLGSALNGHEVTTNVTRINHVPAAELQRIFFVHYDPLEDTMSSISSSSVTVLDCSTDEFRYQRIEHERYFLPYGKAERCHLVSAKQCKHDEAFEQYDHDMNNWLALSREMHGFYDGLSYEVPIMNIYPGKVDDKRSIANRYKGIDGRGWKRPPVYKSPGTATMIPQQQWRGEGENMDKRTARKVHADQFQSTIREIRAEYVKKASQEQPAETPDAEMASDQIHVYVRKRPLLPHEVEKHEFDVISALGEREIAIHECKMYSDMRHKYIVTHRQRFSQCYSEQTETETVYEDTTKRLVLHAMGGGKAVCMMYGQTGSGKTYTMGGMMDYIALDLFTENVGSVDFVDSVSAIEIVGTKCFNLMRDRAKVLVCEDGEGNINLLNSSETSANSATKLLTVLEDVTNQRTTEATTVNSQSSRSHLAVYINLRHRSIDETPGELYGQLVLLDLAGSERTALTPMVSPFCPVGLNLCNNRRDLESVMSVVYSILR